MSALGFDPWASVGLPRPATARSQLAELAELAALAPLRLAAANAEQAADEAADRDAIASEPLLPELGTPERVRLDHKQATMLAGLLAVARPPSSRFV